MKQHVEPHLRLEQNECGHFLGLCVEPAVARVGFLFGTRGTFVQLTFGVACAESEVRRRESTAHGYLGRRTACFALRGRWCRSAARRSAVSCDPAEHAHCHRGSEAPLTVTSAISCARGSARRSIAAPNWRQPKHEQTIVVSDALRLADGAGPISAENSAEAPGPNPFDAMSRRDLASLAVSTPWTML